MASTPSLPGPRGAGEVLADAVPLQEAGRLGEAEAALRETDLPVLAANGARVLGVFEGWVGLPRPSLVHLLAWPDLAARAAAYDAHIRHPAVTAAREREAETGGRPLFAGADVFLLQPHDYGMPRPSLGHFRR